MLLIIYILFEILGIFLFVSTFTNFFNLKRESRLLFSFIAIMLFGILFISSFGIENTSCQYVVNQTNDHTDLGSLVTTINYTNTYQCSSAPIFISPDLTMPAINFFFFIITIINALIIMIYKLGGDEDSGE